ncbi:MAG: hypothetical protein ACRCXA_08225 [Peptostreptococcaceae bacterium]
MLRMRNNKKRNARKKQSKPTDKNYEENYNEVILNDLVEVEQNEEFGVEEAKPRIRKKTGFNLGLGKKKSSNNKVNSNKKQQNLDDVHEPNIEPSTQKASSNEKTSKSKKESSSSKKSSKKSQSKGGKSKVDDSGKNNTSKKSSKKPKSHSSKRKIKKSNSEENLEVKQIIEENDTFKNIEYLEEENINFRSNEPEIIEEEIKPIQKVEEVKPNASKLENIVWSKDNFPKN